MESEQPLASGHTWKKIEGDLYERQARDFKAYKAGMVKLFPGEWFLPLTFPNYADRIYNFEFKPADILVMTYAKMGTTWTQELIWTMRNNPDLNHPLANLPLLTRSPFMEMDSIADVDEALCSTSEKHPFLMQFKAICPGRDPKDGINLQMAEMIPDPRTLKTHLPLSLFPKDLLEKTKVVYVARNPKDGVVSYLHHSRLIKAHGYVGSVDQFVQYFLDDELMYSPYWEHIREAWIKRDHPNMHFIFYEDLKHDTENEVRKLAKFVGVNLTDKQFQNVIEHTSFDKMKKASSQIPEKDEANVVNQDVLKKDGGFFRKGKVGSWKETLSPENEQKIDEWTKKNSADLDGFTFNYT